MLSRLYEKYGAAGEHTRLCPRSLYLSQAPLGFRSAQETASEFSQPARKLWPESRQSQQLAADVLLENVVFKTQFTAFLLN